MEEVLCLQFSTDSIITLRPDDVSSIKYHFFPKYPNVKQPRFIIQSGIAIAMSNYTPAFGNVSTQPILADGLKRGTDYNLSFQFLNRKQFGIVAMANYISFKNDWDSVWAEETFKTVGAGVAWCSSLVIKELFPTGQVLITYSDYTTRGKIPAKEFHEKNELWGLHFMGTLNYHITENLLLNFSGKIHVFHKKPHQSRVTNINAGLFEIGMGIGWML
jgi:hypothetical protein